MGTHPPDYDSILEGLMSMRFKRYVFLFQYTIIPTVECVYSTHSVRKYLVKITSHTYYNVIVENGCAVATRTSKSEFRCSFPCSPSISPTSMQWTYLQDCIQCDL